jgi:putative acetyltransferase
MTVLIRHERPRDVPGVRRVLEAAFEQPDEADLVDALRESVSFRGDLALVAETDRGQVVGHVLFTPVIVGDATSGALALAPVGVDPAWQGQGIGTRLVRAGLEAAEVAGDRLVVVVGEPAYYGRFGFVPARKLGLTTPYDRTAGDAVQALGLRGYEGRPHGAVVYPAPFEGI